MNAKIRPSFSTERQVLGDVLPISTPLSLVLDSSECCNFQCNYCFRSCKDKRVWGYAHDQQRMQWDIFVEAVRQAKQFSQKIKNISLSLHGEPLCNPLLVDMANYITGYELCDTLSIHTNASLLTPDSAVALANAGFHKIIISVQGLTEESYQKNCAYAIDFQDFCSNIRILYEHSRENHTKIYVKIVDAAVEQEEERKKFYEKFSPICDSLYIENVVPIWNDFELEQNRKSSNKFGQSFPKQKYCGLTFYTLVVTPAGDIYPCTQLLSSDRLGNIRDISLKDCWEGTKRKRFLIQHLTDCQPEYCVACHIKQNSIFSEKDMIDKYKERILERLK